ncbi:response regulator [Desulfurispirillum indicum]|uniref:response regulator transcription factor n=1 Tax=Desulfurispirillum indicum TaxID=936456 RepID=UPI001CFA0ADD|nr:response regulator [Desulfurispirillum indicum]UCZ57683.1 response regulator [Desulfurispirillum indicum]
MKHHPLKLLQEMTILFAEDDPIMRDSIARILSTHFRHVLVAEDGAQAMELFNQQRPHIILLDIAMPRASGMEVATAIRQQDPDIPIIILTAHNESEHLFAAIRLRLMEYLVKPVSLDKLRSTFLHCVTELQQRGRIAVQLQSGATYNVNTQSVEWDGKEISLTRNEKSFLDFMLRHRNQVVDADRICFHIDPNHDMTNSGLRNLVYRLRSKIGNKSIVSHKDSGYMVP